MAITERSRQADPRHKMAGGDQLEPGERRHDPRRTESLEKALDILEALAQSNESVGLAALARRLGMNKSTVWRILGTLVRRGYVEHSGAGDSYQLGLNVVRLGSRKLRQMEVVDVGRPIVDDLVERCQETGQLSVRAGNEVLYLHKKQCYRSVQVRTEVGVRRPLHGAASGKVLLAFMPAEQRAALLDSYQLRPLTVHTITDRQELQDHLEGVRRRGYAFDDEENEEGVRCIAAPVQNAMGDVIAAISIAAPATRINLRNVETLAAEVVAAANRISLRLGFDVQEYPSESVSAT